MVQEADLELSDGHKLHYYDTHPDDTDARLPVFWQHGTPSTGAPPEPLLGSADGNGLRWLSYDRPGYGGSTLPPGPGTAARRPARAGTRRRPRPTWLASPTPWASASSRSWGIPAAARTPWP